MHAFHGKFLIGEHICLTFLQLQQVAISDTRTDGLWSMQFAIHAVNQYSLALSCEVGMTSLHQVLVF